MARLSRRGLLQAGGLLALAACSKAGKAGGSARLTVAAASKPGIRAMMEVAGTAAKLPFAPQWVEFDQTAPMLTALSANALDLCSGGDTGLVFLKANAPKANVKAVLAQHIGSNDPADQGCAILVAQSSAIKTIAQLAGKTVAVTQGSVVQYQLLEWLRAAGVSFDAIKTVSLQPAEALSALNSGHIDAWAGYDPFISVAEVNGTARRLPGTAILPVYGLIFASDEALADPAKEQAIRAFLNQLAAAQTQLQTQQDKWIAAAQKATGLPDAVARKSAPRLLATPVPITPEVIGHIQHQADAFGAIGVLKGKVDMAGAFDPRFNDIFTGKGG